MYTIHGHRVDMDNNSVGCDEQVIRAVQAAEVTQCRSRFDSN
jgi:hypothetical protein